MISTFIAFRNRNYIGRILLTAYSHDPNPEDYVKIEIGGSNNPTRTFVITHGLNDDSESFESLANTIKKDPKYKDARVILVDWSGGSKTGDPWRSGRRTKGVGYALARELHKRGVNFENTTFIGHSHGSYVSGWAAVYAKKHYKQTTNGIIGVMYGDNYTTSP